MTPTSRPPRYQLIADELREDIIHCVYDPGDMLPSLNEMAAVYGVSTTPVRVALRELMTEGLVRTVPRHGTYVTMPKDT